MPGPAPRTIFLMAEHLEVVQRDLSRGKTERRVADRCRVLLLSHDGLGPTEIAQGVGWARTSVCRLIARYREEGLSLLHDKPRPGQPRAFSPSGEGASPLAGVHAARA